MGAGDWGLGCSLKSMKGWVGISNSGENYQAQMTSYISHILQSYQYKNMDLLISVSGLYIATSKLTLKKKRKALFMNLIKSHPGVPYRTFRDFRDLSKLSRKPLF